MERRMMNIADAAEQCLDSIVEKHGHKWREDYRKRFAAMVEDVKAYSPPGPATAEREVIRKHHEERAAEFQRIRERIVPRTTP